LQASRGVAKITAVTIVSEVGALSRFPNPRQLMGYSGLVASEFSSGNRILRGHITKTGNAHLRRVLVEAAWCYQYPPSLNSSLRKRQQQLPEDINESAFRSNVDGFS
jgi:transposase